jgi:fructan beta-fructosidase
MLEVLNTVAPTRKINSLYGEASRPLIHFTSQKNWINDPNGMFFYEGVYHLFYQYNPSDSVWGDIHWGHAISKDLVTWEELAPALYPDNGGLGMVFSGGAVVDHQNTSGMKKGSHAPIFLFFTHSNAFANQQQSMAYSLDGAKTWEMWSANPIIPNLEIKDFRDPKVSWCESKQHWVMALAVGHQIWFYISSNLIDWSKASEFGDDIGAHGGVWECPDLFQLTDAAGVQKWVLLVSLNPGGPNGGSATQYFVGEFDGEVFTADDSVIRWLDFGPDNYAAVSWDNTPGERLIVGWMNNWTYANFTPTAPWRGAMTLPRKLELIKDANAHAVINYPVVNLNVLAQRSIDFCKNFSELASALNSEFTNVWRIQAELEWVDGQVDFSLQLASEGDDPETIELVISRENNWLAFDRSNTNAHIIKPELVDGFKKSATAPIKFINGKLRLDIWIDQSSVEVFVNGGETVMTAQYFAHSPLTQFLFKANENQIKCHSMSCQPLSSIWLQPF